MQCTCEPKTPLKSTYRKQRRNTDTEKKKKVFDFLGKIKADVFSLLLGRLSPIVSCGCSSNAACIYIYDISYTFRLARFLRETHYAAVVPHRGFGVVGALRISLEVFAECGTFLHFYFRRFASGAAHTAHTVGAMSSHFRNVRESLARY